MKYFFIALFIIVLIATTASADVVTEQYNVTLNGTVSSDLSEDGAFAVVGCLNGSVYYLNSTGGVVWVNNTGANVTKVILNPSATKVLTMSGTTAYYMDATNGVILAAYSNGTLNDVDLSKNGTNWLVVCNKTYAVLDATNGTVYARNMSENASYTGNWVYGILDPQGQYVITSNSNGHIDKWSYQPGSATWYQGYQYRIVHSIQGSTAGYLNRWNGTSIRIFNTTGSNTGGDIYVGANKTRPDWRDVRIVSPSTGLPYQIYVNNIGANYVNISPIFDNLTALTSYDLYIYYGNASESTDVSNITNTYGEDIGLIYVPNGSIAGSTWMMDSSILSFENSKIGNWVWSWGNASQSELSANTSWKTDGGMTSHRLKAWSNGVYVNSLVSSNAITGVNGSFGYKNVGLSVHFEGDTNATPSATNYSTGYIAIGGSYDDTAILHWDNMTGNYTKNWSTLSLDVNDRIYMWTITCVSAKYSWVAVSVDNITLHRNVSPLPQHSLTGSEQSIPFGTQLQGTIDVNTTARIDMSWDSTWLSASTITKFYNIEITSSGIGTIYSGDASGTVYVLKSGDGDNYAIEGRGLYSNVWIYGADIDGSLSSGNNVVAADVAERSGLYAVSGSIDNYIRLLSKANSSNWYFLWSAPTSTQPMSCSFTEDASYFMYTLSNGNVYYYATIAGANVTTTVTNTYLTLNVFKNGITYAGADLKVYDGGTSGSSYTIYRTGRTDSTGTYTFLATIANVYRVDLIESDVVVKSTTIHANALGTYNIIYMTSYNATNVTAGIDRNETLTGTTINIKYPADADVISVRYVITDTFTRTIVYDNNFTEFPVDANVAVPNASSTYYINRYVVFRTGERINTTTQVSNISANYIPTPFDSTPDVKYIISVIMLILLYALFYGIRMIPIGGIFVSVASWMAVVFGWLPHNVETLLVLSMVSLLAVIFFKQETM